MSYIIKDLRGKLPVHKTKKPKKRSNVDRIVCHCTASDNQDPFKTARYDITPDPKNHICKTGCPTFTYHDAITQDGTMYRCVNYTDITWHAGLYNSRSIGVVMMFNPDKEPPTDIQFQVLKEHLVNLCKIFNLPASSILGHREVPGMWTIIGKGSKKYKKWCPGQMIDLHQLRSDVATMIDTDMSDDEVNLEFFKDKK